MCIGGFAIIGQCITKGLVFSCWGFLANNNNSWSVRSCVVFVYLFVGRVNYICGFLVVGFSFECVAFGYWMLVLVFGFLATIYKPRKHAFVGF